MAVWVFVFCISFAFAAADPCTAHADLPRAVYRGGQCANVYGKEVCDSALTFQWYRARGLNNKDLEIQTTPAPIETCGTKFPFWMNGSHPWVADGEVSRTVCSTGTTNCDDLLSIQVKNCTGFYVYKLRKTPACSMGYCFGAKEPCPPFDPCDVFGHTPLAFEQDRAASCGGISGKCDNFNNTDWYKFDTSSGYLNVSSSCPSVPNACGAPLSIWINGTTRLGNGTDQHTACVKDGTNCCSSTRTILSKQCKSFSVYNFGQQTINPCQRICTDTIVTPCPTLTTVASNNNPSTDKNTAVRIWGGKNLPAIGLVLLFRDIIMACI